MKRIIIALVAAKFAILGSAGVSAGFYSGKGVIANCNSEANYDNGWCAGYLGSWADGDMDMVLRKACIQVKDVLEGKVAPWGGHASPEVARTRRLTSPGFA